MPESSIEARQITDHASIEPDGMVEVCRTDDVIEGSGTCALIDGVQIAVLRSAVDGKVYAVQNRCPHWNEMVLWRGLTGEQDGEPKLACPMHKKTFSLRDGRCLSGEALVLQSFGAVESDGFVYIERPSQAVVEAERVGMGAPCSGDPRES